MEVFGCLQNLLRASSDPVVFCEVNPSNRSRSVHEEFGGTRDVATIFSGVGVNDVVTLDGCRIGVGEDREGESGLLD
jgi:hypothetical protein